VKNFKVYTALSLAIVFWGFSFAGTRYCLEYIHPVWLVFFRLCISIIFLLIIMTVTRSIKRLDRSDVKYFILLAFIEPFIYFMGETYGLRVVSSILSSVIISTIPLFVSISGFLFYKKKPSWQIITGIILSMSGVSLIAFKPDMTLNADPLGILLLFIAVFSAVGYSLLVWRLVQKYSPLEIIAWENTIGIIFFIPLLFFNPVYIGQPESLLNLLGIVVLLGIFPSSLSYLFFNWGVKVIGLNKSSIFTNGIPLVTAFLAFFWLNEIITLQNIVGMLIVVASLTFSQFAKNEKVTTKQT
jgi:drug/metabolite transporter (DMT)-like permease